MMDGKRVWRLEKKKSGVALTFPLWHEQYQRESWPVLAGHQPVRIAWVTPFFAIDVHNK